MDASQAESALARERADSNAGALKLDDLAGLDLSGGEGAERLANMIKLIDSNTKKQIGALERKMKRMTLLEADVEDLKAANGGVEGGNPDVKSKSSGFSAKQLEEFQQCVTNVATNSTRI